MHFANWIYGYFATVFIVVAVAAAVAVVSPLIVCTAARFSPSAFQLKIRVQKAQHLCN